tara:strand:+ start:1103 stop:1273 length:171 start_codon:yes stop_codon:yes gene_type:complete
MSNNFNYEFEIYQPHDDEPTYQYNNSPELTPEFIEFLEDIHIDITNCVYKVTKITD